MRKLQVLFGLALVAMSASLAQAAIPLYAGGADAGTADDIISLVYDPASGNLSLDAAGKSVSTLEVISASGVFTGTKPAQVLPPFDVFTPSKFFLLKTAGMGNEDFGAALAPGLSGQSLAADLTVNGSLRPSGAIGTVNLVVVPEPTTVALLGLGLLGLLGIRRK